MNRDLTVGKPGRVLWSFCVPLFGSIIFQQLYNIADSFVAGKFVGEDALAAVGNSYEVTLIFIAFAILDAQEDRSPFHTPALLYPSRSASSRRREITGSHTVPG